MPASRTFTIPTIFRAIDRFSAPLRAMTARMHGFSAAAEVGLARAERGFRSLMTPLAGVTKLLRYFGYFFGGAAIILGGASVIKTISDFQQANADLNAVMTDSTPALVRQLSDDAKRLGLTTARSATQVVGLQTELAKLGYQGPEILNMTKSLVAGSIAMDAELDRTATLGGAMVRTFTKFTSADMPKIMDMMTLATLDTALSFEKLETMLPIVSGAANAVGISFSRQLALLGKLSDAGIDASSSATALRNIFIDSRRRGHSYDKVLENIKKHADMLTPAFNKFGKRGAVSAVVLADKLKEVILEENRLINSLGTADRVAKTRLNSMQGSLTLLKAAWSGFILTLDDGTGKFSGFLKGVLDTTRGVLLLTAGTKDSMVAFKDLSPEIQKSSENTLKWLGISLKVIKALIFFKLALIAARIALVSYSLWIGIAGALTGVASIAIGQSAIALGAYRTAAFLAATATGPFVLGVLAIIAVVDSFSRHWADLEGAFESGNLLRILDAISATIMDAILYPIQKVFELLGSLPGFLGAYFRQAATGMERIRKFVGATPSETPAGVPDRFQHLSERSKQAYMSAEARTAAQVDEMLMKRGQAQFQGSLAVEYSGPDFLRPRSTSDSVSVKVGSSMGYGPIRK